MGGVAHVEAVTGRQIGAKNVVVMFSTETPASDPYTPGAIHFRTEGSGPATVYEDGRSIKATCTKDAMDGALKWRDGTGNEIKLNRGNTWMEVVPQGNQVTVS